MIRRPPRSTQGVSSAASDVYKRQVHGTAILNSMNLGENQYVRFPTAGGSIEEIVKMEAEIDIKDIITQENTNMTLSLIHISEPTRPLYISYAVFCLKKKKKNSKHIENENNKKENNLHKHHIRTTKTRKR
eukprot:TRINITY_DN21805_c0_g1_i1.p2 TRINITY_DN21805_c0_g1~~TRINITY_DN21805_c0_g1_i1.p2  ORF type:complete len:131 (-),score=37.48 TRINITY_DN21805_c0_g1_i1:6-398(-)